MHRESAQPTRPTNGRRFGNVLLLGGSGGVATALINLLARHPAGREIADRIDALYLLDKDDSARPLGTIPPGSLAQAVPLPPQRVRRGSELAPILRDLRIDQLVELAEIDTFDCVYTAAEHGVNFLCSGLQSYEIWPELQARLGDAGCRTPLALLPPNRPRIERGSHMIGSGMNPGIVNAMVSTAIDHFADRRGVARDHRALDLYALFFTEEDSTRELGADESADVFRMSWSPDHCLNEVQAPPASVYIEGGLPQRFEHSPHRATYRARCGHAMIDGMLVAHEEVYTIGSRYPELQLGYLYQLLPSARRALARAPDRPTKAWTPRKLYPPFTPAIDGFDRVGILLCSRTYGELWMGFENRCDEALARPTNATLLQVAAGVLAGWHQLGERPGIHLIEELDVRRYFDVATSILGPPFVVYDPEAPVLPLAARRSS